ncbi:MAG: hypothetical protein AAF945_08370 [Actinomycetota bacterium]
MSDADDQRLGNRRLDDPAHGDPDPGDDLDFRGSRRLTGREEWFWYLAAAVSYILLGIWHKWLLNWFVGPAWLVAFVVIGPWLTDRLGWTGRRSRSDGGDDG